MKINIKVYKDDKNRYIAYDPDNILKGRTFAYTKEVLEKINLPELKDISVKVYIKEKQEIPEQLTNFEGFNINYE